LISPFLDWWALLAWSAINILVPVLLPLLILKLLTVPQVTSQLARDCVVKSIGKGELFWAAMGMAAATCYELFALQKLVSTGNSFGLTWFVIWIHLGIILCSAIVVGLGSLNEPLPACGNPHIPDRRVFWASIATLIVTAGSYTTVHAIVATLEARDKSDKITRLAICLKGDPENDLQCMEVLK